MSVHEKPVYRFADCELDPDERRLLVQGRPVTLTPKVFDTLVLLVERAGHVVRKDELMAALWPRGYVQESNLTKHIWLIRRALGDHEGEGESRYIETVPKLGYRFVAPVLRAPAHAIAPDAQPQLSRPKRQRFLVPAASVLAIVAIAAGGLQLWRSHRNAQRSMTSPDAGAVAIVDFNNLSGNAKDAWLGPALQQMLATEVAANGTLHAVSEELVRPARADLPAPDAGGYSPSSLTTLQRRLGAHYVLSGAYLVSGAANTPQLRIDLTVQDAKTGEMFASLSRTSEVNDLPHLVAQIGEELRNHFGESSPTPGALRQLAAAQPPTSEVARHIGFALQALSQYDPARARDELLQAIAQAPGYALTYLYLARSWSMLGYRAKALAAARQALDNADGLPEEERLQIQSQQLDLQADHVNAPATYGKLVALRPQNPDYRLQLVAALTDAGEYDQADAALAAARKLPRAEDDARIELAAANIESARGNLHAIIPHARLALEKAQRNGDSGLVAEAELQLGIALWKDAQAEPLLRKAAADFRQIDNPHGEALAWQNVGNLQYAQNQVDAARESYQRAMSVYQGIGDLGGEAAIYDDLSRMLWGAGDRDGTETALRQALRISRETGDLERQAWSLTGLATILADESASDEALAMYRQAVALDRQSGAHAHLAFALSYTADLLRIRGQLDEASGICAQARAADRALEAASRTIDADFECAQIALDRGETDAAVATLTSIENTGLEAKDTFNTANAQLILGEVAMGRREWIDARDLLQKSLAGWTAMKEVPGEATAQALLALCYSSIGDDPARDRSSGRARELRVQIIARQEALTLDIALAELRGETGKAGDGVTSLRAIANDALERHWIGLAFEARLAAQRLLESGTDRTAAEASHAVLEAAARKAGYGWVDQRLARMQGPLAR